jgi:transposase
MEELPIFTSALGIEAPWYIKRIYFEGIESDKRLYIEVAHRMRSKFVYAGEWYPVYDHQDRTWKHLKFFQHECYVYGSVPRVKTKDGEVRLVEVPWARAGSSFTLLFEHDIVSLVQGGMSASKAGQRMGISGKRVFRIISRHVSTALSHQDLEDVKELSVDETSSRKGHKYLTILTDRVAKKVVGVAVGKDKEAFAHALIDMEVRGAERNKVRTITMDMSKSYIAGAEESMPEADIVFDRFHIVKKMNEAVDSVRRSDQQNFKELKNTRYLWLRNQTSLNEEQRQQVESLAQAFPNIGQAYRLRELLKTVLDNALYSKRLSPINAWINEAWKSGLEPIQDFVRMLCKHWYGIKTYFKKVADNAYAERVNLKIQEIKRIAKGYRNIQNFILMIYFHLGGLDFKIHYK